jgi:hypothetical protein
MERIHAQKGCAPRKSKQKAAAEKKIYSSVQIYSN